MVHSPTCICLGKIFIQPLANIVQVFRNTWFALGCINRNMAIPVMYVYASSSGVRAGVLMFIKSRAIMRELFGSIPALVIYPSKSLRSLTYYIVCSRCMMYTHQLMVQEGTPLHLPLYPATHLHHETEIEIETDQVTAEAGQVLIE